MGPVLHHTNDMTAVQWLASHALYGTMWRACAVRVGADGLRHRMTVRVSPRVPPVCILMPPTQTLERGQHGSVVYAGWKLTRHAACMNLPKDVTAAAVTEQWQG